MKFSLDYSQAQVREMANTILQAQITEERLSDLDARDQGHSYDRDMC